MENRIPRTRCIHMVFVVFLSLLVTYVEGVLNIKPGSLEGTEYDANRGLSDKQLGILRWIANISEVPSDGSPMTWDHFNIDPSHQLDMDSLRYSLAFLAYATSGMTYEHTPAYREVASSVLNHLFQRMVQPIVWSYWSQNSLCGKPWKSFCAKHKTSMCTINNMGYMRGADCPDPVKEANIMYSAHLSQMGLLFELHSHDTTLSTHGWDFVKLDPATKNHTSSFRYNLPGLMEVLEGQSNMSKVGGGITCEPGSVFPSCNNHVYISFRLSDAMHGTHFGGRGDEWYDYMLNHTYNHSIFPFERDSNKRVGVFGRRRKEASNDPLFKIISIPPLAADLHDPGGIPFQGCAAHDGWVLSWLSSWAPSSGTSDIKKAWMNVVADNIISGDLEAVGNDIATGAYLNDTCTGQSNWITSMLASSWVPLVGRQLTDGTPCALCDSVYRHFEDKYATLGDSVGDGLAQDMYFYNTTGYEQLLATANLALSMAVGNTTLERLYSQVAVDDYDLNKPHLAHVPWPEVMVRRAHYVEGTKELKFTVLGSRQTVNNAVLVCEGYDTLFESDKSITVLKNGVIYTNWTTSTQRGRQQLFIRSDISNDAMFDVAFQ